MGVHDADYNKVKDALGIPHDEPIFVIRAKDACAPSALDHYFIIASAKGAEDDFLDGVRKVEDEMNDWQTKNAKKVGVPT
jgi:hypothetical protein